MGFRKRPSAEQLLDGLNDGQREAVATTDGPLLVLSGAGTGKTRVLVTRTGYLVASGRTQPERIMAVTFTTKAAAEMKERLRQMRIPVPTWLGTFHSLWRRFLVERPDIADLKEGFVIADVPHQRRIVRDLVKKHGAGMAASGGEGEKEKDPVKTVMAHFDDFKGRGLRPEEAADYVAELVAAEGADIDPMMPISAQLYPLYQDALRAENMADFNDLMLWPTLAMRDDEELCQHWASYFTHILIDEFQDTSIFQWEGVRLLAAGHRNLCAVGDDDQSIYAFRLAEVDNILGFTEDYPDATVVRLVENYRCSGNILAAANAVIACNELRMGKNLMTTKEAGAPLIIAGCPDDRSEAKWIVEQIAQAAQGGEPLDEIAVLYRNNYLSRGVQEALLGAKIAHEVIGDAAFYDRSEVKDAVSYLALMANTTDDEAFERICNKPARGIGAVTFDLIKEHAAAQEMSLFDAAKHLAADFEAAPLRTAQDIRGEQSADDAMEEVYGFRALGAAAGAAVARSEAKTVKLRADAIAGLRQLVPVIESGVDGTAGDTLRRVLDESGYMNWIPTHASDGVEAVDNLDELVRATDRWPSVQAFLEHLAALKANADDTEDTVRRVKLMSLHRSKGLEFNIVFLLGWEEGVFPSDRASGDRQLEEERRLAYVGLTRGRRQVSITTCARRFADLTASRFIDEIPEELTVSVTVTASKGKPLSVTPGQVDFSHRIARSWRIPAPDGNDPSAVIAFLDRHAEAFRSGARAPLSA